MFGRMSACMVAGSAAVEENGRNIFPDNLRKGIKRKDYAYNKDGNLFHG